MQQLNIAAADSVLALPQKPLTPLSAQPIEDAFGEVLLFALQCGPNRTSLKLVCERDIGYFACCRKQIHEHRNLVCDISFGNMPGPHRTRGDSDAAFIHITLLPTQRSVMRADLHIATVVGSIDDEGVGQLPGLLKRIQHAADAGIHVLNERDVFRALWRDIGFAFTDARYPLIRRLDGGVRCIIGKVKEKRRR